MFPDSCIRWNLLELLRICVIAASFSDYDPIRFMLVLFAVVGITRIDPMLKPYLSGSLGLFFRGI